MTGGELVRALAGTARASSRPGLVTLTFEGVVGWRAGQPIRVPADWFKTLGDMEEAP